MNSRFAIVGDDFVLDGGAHRVLAGAVHYFRVHPGQWVHRIRLARQMGLNTIETYIPWNENAPRRGEFVTEGRLDLERFLHIVQDEGMHAIVRPGPYICAEWDNGGLPGWLTRECGTRIRRSEPAYLEAVEEYLRQALAIVAPLQIDRRGPVILVQVENEYGAYGSDKAYLRRLVEVNRAAGITVPLTTIDQPIDRVLADGSLPELLKTASFGSRAAERLAMLRAHQPTGPLMCAEFWDGWFDHWGGHHHTTSAEEAAHELDGILAAGASVSIYMFHGGTNFGFTNGANHKGHYEPTVTSYDYDAPLSESGEPTEKFWAFRDVISRYVPVPPLDPGLGAEPEPSPAFEVPWTASVGLLDQLAADASPVMAASTTDAPISMDELAQFRGFAHHSVHVPTAGLLEFAEVRDRAQLFLDGEPIGVLERQANDRAVLVPRAGRLDVVVEDMGRVNYGPRIGEAKGLIGPATLDGAAIGGWTSEPVVLEQDGGRLHPAIRAAVLDAEPRAGGVVSGPQLRLARFELAAPVDLYLHTATLGKGAAWLNGFPLGRYWSRGPQRTAYVPGGATRAGVNELVLLDLPGVAGGGVRFVERADLGHTEA